MTGLMKGAMQSHKHLVLLGAGHAHVHLLAQATRQSFNGARVTLVAPFARQLYSGMVPGFVAGHYALDDCVIALAPLLEKNGIRWLQQSVTALDAPKRRLRLEDGTELAYDWLSVNTGPVQDRQLLETSLPGVREHGLFVRPIEAFCHLWPQVLALAAQRTLRLAVIGGGAAGLELVMAVRQRLPTASVTLIAGEAGLGTNYPDGVQQRLRSALKARRITVLNERATALHAGEIELGNGARLLCDVPLVATGAQAPAWLQGSGLALDAQGFIAVDACLRSTNHPEVLAAGDVSARQDRPLARSGVYAVRAGPALARNLEALVAGQPLREHQPPIHTLNLLSCGDQHAIATWGKFSAQGRWVWWLKDWIDRSFVQRFRRH